MRASARTAGFTLLEVLVAISIFALVGVASYQVLSTVLQTDSRLSGRSEQLRQINRAFWLIQQDIEHLAQRPVRDAAGSPQPYLAVNPEAELPLQFSRGARANPLGLPRSNIQRVAYRVGHHPDADKSDSPHYEDERWYLLRYSWAKLDGAGDTEQALVQVLLPDIEELKVEVQGNTGWQPQWPPQLAPGQTDQPSAIRLELQHPIWGTLLRLYQVL